MRYYGAIYRPPSEAYSLLVQVTIGCAHNKCTFCNMFKAKNFRVRDINEVFEDLEDARVNYRKIDRIFLCDGDALCLSMNRLRPIYEKIRELFPECERVTTYGRASDILRKTDDELLELKKLGLTMVYMGAESGSDTVLKMVNKGETREELIEAVKKIERLGIKASVTFISGLAGPELMREHAVETGTMIREMNASYVSLLTLMLEEPAPIVKEVREGRFTLLTPLEVLEETCIILENARPEKECVFRSNHASNYVNLKGNLPYDNDKMIEQIKHYMKNTNLLKNEMFRML
ncbi:MAG: radical SAM protein [Clostridia bacterium]|nr:radical SAM protein [Clostridia bacterium]